ncbi:Asp23/Gls24 family envelope stress response protein [Streptomyces sp. bgisy100]|uniref:Asp23/Gls24 family envelope stress response protein n=1 Tax=Streptomyces sp. bgisy100 TaxID=3413783 RepID=UPI003D71A55E
MAEQLSTATEKNASRGAGVSTRAAAPSATAKPAAPTERGSTSIADGVVVKIAAMATRDVPGIHDLGAGMARTLGAVRERTPGMRPSVARGVKAEVGERQAALDIDVVVEYGAEITNVAGEVRESVVEAVERMTGFEVVEVNVAVDDVHLPGEEDEESEGARVR